MASEQSREAFWNGLEDELGESITHRCIAQYLDGTYNRPRDSWSIFVTTEAAMYLIEIPTESWQERLKSIFTIGTGSARTGNAGLGTGDSSEQESPKRDRLRIGVEEITAVEVDAPKNWWQHLVRPYPKNRLQVVVGTDWMTLAPDADVEVLAAALRKPEAPA